MFFIILETEEYKTTMKKIISDTIFSLSNSVTNYFKLHANQKADINNILINVIKNLTELINLTLKLSTDNNYKFCLKYGLMNKELNAYTEPIAYSKDDIAKSNIFIDLSIALKSIFE